MIPGLSGGCPKLDVRNPADRRDIVGQASFALGRDVAMAFGVAKRGGESWSKVPTDHRADILDRAAGLLTERMGPLLGLIIREAGKSPANAIAEIREAVDFLRYYAQQARASLTQAQAPSAPSFASRHGISRWRFSSAKSRLLW
jgi:RHH-type proline utilization regulon transcriptional repressor/proline dehydrogenase/delta 1-pyrroline-5-carboxylate dehydrogenase